MYDSPSDDNALSPHRFAQAIAQSGGKPFAFDDGDMRTLHFDERFIQSAMRISQPDELLLSYTRAMMAFVLFQSEPSHILMIGLGGGSLAKYCYRTLPNSRITVVENDPDIIAMRGQFRVPDDDQRFQVILADALDYLPGLHSAVDVILHDGYGAEGLSAPLCDTAFYQACWRALAPDGLLVSNLWEGRDELLPLMQRLHQVFHGNLWWCNPQWCMNRIVMSPKSIDVTLFRATLARRAMLQDARHDGLDLRQLAHNLSTSEGRTDAEFLAMAGNAMHAAYLHAG